VDLNHSEHLKTIAVISFLSEKKMSPIIMMKYCLIKVNRYFSHFLKYLYTYFVTFINIFRYKECIYFYNYFSMKKICALV
jgi:GTP-dependent phosphoenolpyruvate carboxykinase